MDPISFRKKKSIPIVVLCLGEWKNYLVIEKVDIKTEHEYFFIKNLISKHLLSIGPHCFRKSALTSAVNCIFVSI